MLGLQNLSGIDSSIYSGYLMGIEIGAAQLFGKKRKADLQQLVKMAALSTEDLYSPPNIQWQIRFYREIDSISNPIVGESDKSRIIFESEIFHRLREQLTPELN